MADRIKQTNKDLSNPKSSAYRELEKKQWPVLPVESRVVTTRSNRYDLDNDIYWTSLPSRPHPGEVIALPLAVLAGILGAAAGAQTEVLGAVVGGGAGFGITQLVFS